MLDPSASTGLRWWLGLTGAVWAGETDMHLLAGLETHGDSANPLTRTAILPIPKTRTAIPPVEQGALAILLHVTYAPMSQWWFGHRIENADGIASPAKASTAISPALLLVVGFCRHGKRLSSTACVDEALQLVRGMMLSRPSG